MPGKTLASLVTLVILAGCTSLPQSLSLIPEETDPELFLRGNFNGWSAEADPFEFEGAGLYVLEREFGPGTYRFQVTDNTWSCQASYGEADDSYRKRVLPGSSFAVQRCSDSKANAWDKQRNSITLKVTEPATYYFTLKTALNPPRLVIVRGKDVSRETPRLAQTALTTQDE